MARFRTLSIDAAGKLVRAEVEATSEAEVIASIRRQGMLPMKTGPAGGGWLLALLNTELGRGAALSRQEAGEMIGELAVMLGAGQDIDSALRFLVETAPHVRIRGVAMALRDDVRAGGTLADAMGRQAGSFRLIDIALVRAGEASARLAETLQNLAGLLERQRALIAAVQSAMIYPALLLTAATGAIVLMLTQVLPQFVPLFEQNGAQLPASTRLLIAAGDALGAHGLTLAAGLAVLVAVWLAALRRPRIRLLADRLLLHLPVIGALSREVLAARFTRTLGTLLGSGVPLIAALAIVRDAMGNLAARAAVETASLSARGGGGLAAALGAAGVFPVRAIHLLRLGEAHAQLGTMALRAADIHEARTAQSVQRLLALLVPAITIIMGAAVAGIVASLLLAMLSLNDLAV